MSASQMERLACSQAISIPSKRVFLSDPSQLPDLYSSTPGGTLYSTTPGGTRIIYEKNFMLSLKNSPLSRTPPKNFIPSGLIRGNPNSHITKHQNAPSRSPPKSHHHHQQQPKSSFDDHQEIFDMDI